MKRMVLSFVRVPSARGRRGRFSHQNSLFNEVYNMNINRRILLALLCLVPLVFGCTKSLNTETVTGTITLDGVPLEGASVSFSPMNPTVGHPAFGKTDSQGVYKLQTLQGEVDAGTTPGKYRVAVSKFKQTGTGKFTQSAEHEQIEIMSEELVTPEKYRKAATSGLEAEVVGGKNTFDFDLKSK